MDVGGEDDPQGGFDVIDHLGLRRRRDDVHQALAVEAAQAQFAELFHHALGVIDAQAARVHLAPHVYRQALAPALGAGLVHDAAELGETGGLGDHDAV